MNNVLVYHPTGNQNVRALLRGLSSLNILQSYHTTIAVFANSWYYKFIRGKLSLLKRRTFPDSIREKTILYPWLEIQLMCHRKNFRGHLLTGSLINKLVANKVAKYILRQHKHIDTIYGYPFGSYALFQEAKKYKIKCVYEQATGYYKALKAITGLEKQRHPDWASTITIYEEPKDILDRLDKELEMSDTIIAASSYIKQTLTNAGYSPDKITVIPYGFPKVTPKHFGQSSNRGPLKLIFAGSISQIKGLSYLFEAVEGLSDKVELTLIGAKNNKLSKSLDAALAKHNYLGPLSHEDLLNKMHEADVMVFPTLCDGFGMVMTEAMSQGTPVIATVNSGAPDIIRNGENGWLVPIQDSQAIRKVILSILENKDKLPLISQNALQTAAQRPWAIYEKEVSTYLSNLK